MPGHAIPVAEALRLIPKTLPTADSGCLADASKGAVAGAQIIQLCSRWSAPRLRAVHMSRTDIARAAD